MSTGDLKDGEDVEKRLAQGTAPLQTQAEQKIAWEKRLSDFLDTYADDMFDIFESEGLATQELEKPTNVRRAVINIFEIFTRAQAATRIRIIDEFALKFSNLIDHISPQELQKTKNLRQLSVTLNDLFSSKAEKNVQSDEAAGQRSEEFFLAPGHENTLVQNNQTD